MEFFWKSPSFKPTLKRDISCRFYQERWNIFYFFEKYSTQLYTRFIFKIATASLLTSVCRLTDVKKATWNNKSVLLEYDLNVRMLKGEEKISSTFVLWVRVWFENRTIEKKGKGLNLKWVWWVHDYVNRLKVKNMRASGWHKWKGDNKTIFSCIAVKTNKFGGKKKSRVKGMHKRHHTVPTNVDRYLTLTF